MRKFPLVSTSISLAATAVAVVLLQFVGGEARLPLHGVLMLLVGFPLVVFLLTMLLSIWLRWQTSVNGDLKSLAARSGELGTRLGRLEYEQMKEYTRDAMEMKKDVYAMEKRRVIVINAVGQRDVSRTQQVLTRREPGPPIDRFPVILHTDRRNISFQDLTYKILTPDVAQFRDYEREVMGDLTIFTIHNRLKKLISYGETVTFEHQTECDLDSPEGDWIGIETSGGPNVVGIKVWFPPKYKVLVCHAYCGTPPNPDKDELALPEPRIEQGTLGTEDILRAHVTWEKHSPTPDTTYYIAWEAGRISPTT